MAKKQSHGKTGEKQKGKSAKEDSEEFSVIMGTGRSSSRTDEEESEEGVEEKAPEPEEEVVKKRPEKALEKLSLPELLRKRKDLELFLISLEDAHKRSKFPEYTYEKMKKRHELELSMIKQRIEKMDSCKIGIPTNEKASPKRILAEVNLLLEKKLHDFPSTHTIEELGNRIERMASALKKIPSLRSRLNRLKDEIEEYHGVMKEVKSHEKLLDKDLSGIRESLSALRDEVIQHVQGKEGLGEKIKQSVDSAVENVKSKVDSVSKKLDTVFGKLNKRIEQVSVIEESETAGYVDELKKSIEEIRSGLSSYVKKGDLEKIVLRPVLEGAKGSEEGEKVATEVKPKKRQKDTVDIADLPGFVDKDVTVQGSLSMLKSIEEKGMRLYWYRIKDKTGEGVLTSNEKLPEKILKIKGDVKETKTGSVYVFFKRILSD